MIVSAGKFSYRVIEDWGQGPEGTTIDGHTAGFAFGTEGQVYVSRYNSGTRRILVFDTAGRFIREWGKDVVLETHYLGVGPDGMVFSPDPRDHTVRKFTPEGELLMTLGTANQVGEPGMPFNGPTKVVVTAAGDFFVSDGYNQNRIHRYSPDGKLLYSWGEAGSEPGQLNQPHGMCLDPWGRIMVADRMNHRVQIFTQQGKFLEQWDTAGLALPHDMCVDQDNIVYVNDGNMVPHEGRINIFTLEGELLGRLAVNDYTPPVSSWMHGINVDADRNLYITDLAGVHKLERV
ncbi:MAG: hypothetical protein EXR62_09700 [Chloroflexi bacterium]|nr:hypothetical protein [Chloroflexota bacterium]